jgi:hypothetical protein
MVEQRIMRDSTAMICITVGKSWIGAAGLGVMSLVMILEVYNEMQEKNGIEVVLIAGTRRLNIRYIYIYILMVKISIRRVTSEQQVPLF